MKDKRGIVLVTALITVLVIIMFLTSAIILMPGGLNATRDAVENEMARRAADSGLRYARLRLKENENWRGGADGQVTVVNEGPDKMVVVEDTGNVVGYMRNPDGTVAQFRIRFNHQDGSGGTDGRDDPTLTIDHPYVSTNNLTGNTGFTEPDGGLVPPNKAHVVVEGRAGPGLNALTPGNPNAATNGRTVSSYVEAFFQSNNAGRVNAVMSAGGEIDVTLTGSGEIIMDSADITKGPLMQGNQSVTANGGDTTANLVRANADGAGSGKGKGKGKGKNDKSGPSIAPADVKYSVADNVNEGPLVNVTQDTGGPSYLDLQWSEIVTATATDATISGGTYVLYGNQLYHYDQEYLDPVVTTPGIPADPGDPNAVPPIPPTPAVPPVMAAWEPPPAPDASATLVPNDFGTGTSSITWGMETNVQGQGPGATKHTGVGINVNDNVLVTPSANGVESVAFVNGDPGKTSDNIMLRFDPPQDVAILSTTGDFWVKGKIEGTGVAITAEGEINMEGAGFNLLVEPKADTTLNLYAQGDINISSYNEKNGDYGDMSANGIIYTWSNFNADLGGDGVFYLSGAMEALGGTPGAGNGGTAGGNIDINASEVYLGYDSAYLDALLKVRENNLQMTMYKRF